MEINMPDDSNATLVNIRALAACLNDVIIC